MDPATLHLVVSAILAAALGLIGWLFKGFISKINDLEKDLSSHKLIDAAEFAKLNVHKDEMMRRLDNIDTKLDKLLERP